MFIYPLILIYIRTRRISPFERDILPAYRFRPAPRLAHSYTPENEVILLSIFHEIKLYHFELPSSPPASRLVYPRWFVRRSSAISRTDFHRDSTDSSVSIERATSRKVRLFSRRRILIYQIVPNSRMNRWFCWCVLPHSHPLIYI